MAFMAVRDQGDDAGPGARAQPLRAAAPGDVFGRAVECHHHMATHARQMVVDGAMAPAPGQAGIAAQDLTVQRHRPVDDFADFVGRAARLRRRWTSRDCDRYLPIFFEYAHLDRAPEGGKGRYFLGAGATLAMFT